jgi:hypothetical protein
MKPEMFATVRMATAYHACAGVTRGVVFSEAEESDTSVT